MDEKDEVVGQADKDEAHQKNLPHRLAHIFIFNDQGEMAMQLRSREVNNPLHWITAGSGHVKSGENYLDGAKKELFEEIGVKDIELEFMSKDFFTAGNERLFLGVFRGTHNGPFSPDPKEVEKIDFFSLDEIRNMVNRGEKFHPQFTFLLKKHFNIS